jgi:hypothetical protein
MPESGQSSLSAPDPLEPVRFSRAMSAMLLKAEVARFDKLPLNDPKYSDCCGRFAVALG